MATDYLSALNVGSGLNTTEIIDSLVAAERAPREKLITDAKDKRTVEISSLGQVKTNFDDFDSGLGMLDGVTGLNPYQVGNSTDIEITDKAVAGAFAHQIGITQLAQAQTLVFDGFAGEAAAIGTGTLSFAFGTWNGDGSFSANADRSSVDITIDASNNTLSGVRDAINAAGMDVTAAILKTGESSYALTLKSREGANHALKITATESPAASGLATLGYATVDASIETIAAADAEFTLDGVSVTRQSNEVDDLIAGVTVTLKAETAQAETIGARYDSNLALVAMRAVVEQINGLQTTLTDLSKRGSNGAEGGPLAGDPLVRSLLGQLRSYTTTPINGFGSTPRYLAEFGVQTSRDGSVSLDEDTFKAAFDADPDSLAAILNSRVTTDSTMVSASVTGSQYKAGVYAFAIAGDGSATLDGAALTRSGDRFTVTEGDAKGLRIDITGDGRDTNIYIGTSLLENLRGFAETVLGANSAIDSKLQRYNDDLRDYDDQLSALDVRIAAIRTRYVEQFSAMERAVTALKETGTGLENMMEAWRAGLQQ